MVFDIDLYKIPVMGVSACDTASFLKVVVDAVNTLANQCPESEGGDSNNTDTESDTKCSGTFREIEVKLEALLRKMEWGGSQMLS